MPHLLWLLFSSKVWRRVRPIKREKRDSRYEKMFMTDFKPETYTNPKEKQSMMRYPVSLLLFSLISFIDWPVGTRS
jgi:hypothetical protein